MDYGSHTPFILAAYSVSIVAIAALIGVRVAQFRAAKRAEQKKAND